jgi:hypothetical protein
MVRVIYLKGGNQADICKPNVKDGFVKHDDKKHFVDGNNPLKAIFRKVSFKKEPRLKNVKPFCKIKTFFGFGKERELYILSYNEMTPAQTIETGKEVKVSFNTEKYNVSPELLNTILNFKITSNLATKNPLNLPNSTILGAIIGGAVIFFLMIVIQSMGWVKF